MTPKEKAEELFTKHKNAIGINTKSLGLYYSKKECINSAIITVDEFLINSRNHIPILIPSNEIVCSPEWWREVKTELEKL
jgi:hypothetical protein